MVLTIVLIVVFCAVLYLFINKGKSTPLHKIFGKLKDKVIVKEDSEETIKEEENEVIIKEEENEEIHTDDFDNLFESENYDDLFNDDDEVQGGQKECIYLDISVNNNDRNRVIIELRGDICPKTCKNFLEMCKEKKYKNSRFHRVIKDFMIQGGDVVNGDGSGGYSIYGPEFEDENFKLPHVRGCISMANHGPNTNGCQFFIPTTDALDHLNGKHVVFGKVVQGMDTIDYISDVETDEKGRPFKDVVILDCGILGG